MHTGHAANAPPIVEIDNAVVATIQCRYRTDFDAWCVVTVIATHDREKSPGIGKCSFFNVLHPSSIHADWDVVFRFASHRTGMATDAAAIVNDETVVLHECFPMAAWVTPLRLP